MIQKKFKRLIIVFIIIAMMPGCNFTPQAGAEHVTLENKVITGATVDYTLSGIFGKVTVETVDTPVNTTAGSKSPAIDINVVGGRVDTANISFQYNEEELSTPEDNLKIAYYNEDLKRMELLENSKVDTENNTVSVVTDHFSKYIVVDSDEWYDAWAKSQLLMRSMIDGTRYFNICFALDSSGSMAVDDKNQLSKDCTYNFIYNLYGGDNFTLYDFDDDVYTDISTITRDNILSIDSIKSDIMSIDADGGTDIDKALKTINARFSSENSSDLVNLAILLTDGISSVSDDTIKESASKGIKVITIGFGDDVNEELLTKIAGETNGKYYKANTSDIQDIFNDIRQSYIGVDVETDTDGDGIPDVIETTGMRNQYGNMIVTDPQNADTDGDGISDGVEMGSVVINDSVNETDKANNVSEYIYFDMISDPTVYNENTEYEPKVIVEHSSEVAQDKSSINYSFTVKNISSAGSPENGNIINFLRNAKAQINIPDCCTANSNLGITIGNLANSEQYDITGTLTHDKTKCSGEKHVISATITADNLKSLYDEIRLDNMYWFEDENIGSDYRIAFIQKVRSYTSKSYEGKNADNNGENDKNAENDNNFNNFSNFDNLGGKEIYERHKSSKSDSSYNSYNSNNSYKSPAQRTYSGLYNNVDINTIIEATNEASNQQPYDYYKYLCNNNSFLASGYRDYLFGDSLKATATRVFISLSDATMGSGLFKTLTRESERERYREALLNYINNDIQLTKSENEAFINANLIKQVHTAYKDMFKMIQSNDLENMDKLSKQIDDIVLCKDVSALSSELEELNKEFSKLGFDYAHCDKYMNLEFKFSKANVSLKSPLSLFDNGLNVVKGLTDLIEIEANLELYQNYIDFLTEIENGTCINELKTVASGLKTEFSNKQSAFLSECAKYFKNELYSSSDIALLEAAFGAESTILSTYEISQLIASLIANDKMGLKETLDNATYVICLAECSEVQAKKLERCASKFNNAYIQDIDSAYSAAKDFAVQYNNTVEIRKLAEDSYNNLVKIDTENYTYSANPNERTKKEVKGLLGDQDYSKEINDAVKYTKTYLDIIRFSY